MDCISQNPIYAIILLASVATMIARTTFPGGLGSE